MLPIECIGNDFLSGVLKVSKYVVSGGNKLCGCAEVQGSKNSALPLMAAAVLTDGESVLFNCPDLTDVDASMRILRYLGCEAERESDAVIINSSCVCKGDIPDELMREMRSSIVFLGAILSRCKRAVMTFPGGCELGPRPIDMHLKALKAMGAKIVERYGVIECSAADGLKGAKIALSFPSVGATENIILAAVKADGTTTITNAAREPEIVDLCDFLNKAGARIYGAGEGVIVIDGVKTLHGTQHTIIPDRIVAATLMSAAAMTGSDIEIEVMIQAHLSSIIPVCEESGCDIKCDCGTMRIKAPERLKAMPLIRTMPYPGFPTDAQAPVMAAAAVAQGTSVFVENIFENRYKHVSELIRLGADIKVENKVAVVSGVRQLYAANVRANDLRGAAGLIAAALAAEGTTEISGIEYLERGYENFELLLSSLGAEVVKI